MSFLFKGLSSENFFVVEKIRRSLLPPITNTVLDIPNKAGATHQNTSLGVLRFEIDIRIRENSIVDLNAMKRAVADWLYSEDSEEFILTKEPDIYYMAKLDGDTPLDEIVTVGKGTLIFLAFDPLGLSRILHMHTIPSGTESYDLDIEGTYKTFPLIRATFNQDATIFTYATANENEQVIVGKPVDVNENQQPRQLNELIFSNTGTSLTGFDPGGTFLETGVIGGEMIAVPTSPSYLTFSSLGTSTTTWHGPVVKAALSTPLDNWRVDWYIRFNLANPKELGRIQLYLLDINNNVLGLLGMSDASTLVEDAYGQVRLGGASGGRNLIYEHGDRPGNWNDFSGIIRLEKNGQVYNAYIAKIDGKTGVHHTRRFARFVDVNNRYSENGLAQVMLHIGTYRNYPQPSNARIYSNNIYVYRRNKLLDTDIPYIFRAGDILEIDHFTKEVTLNGEPYKQHLNPISNPFAFSNSLNSIGFAPNDVADVEVLYRSRWL